MGAELPYDFETVGPEWSGVQFPVPVTIWRSVDYSYNTFAIESFLDELAFQAGEDFVEYRRRFLFGQPRLQDCLEEVARVADWEVGWAEGRTLGVAVYYFGDTAVAQVAEIEKDDNAWRVSKFWCAVNCGTVVNPDIVTAQIEGGIIFGLSAALYGEIEIQNGRVHNDNFDKHRLVRIGADPEIAVSLMPSTDSPSGVGEVAVPGVAPALANALFTATGERVRSLPLTVTQNDFA
jgi:isoquinoline 1-oxidoreductase beta subunit